MTHVRSRFSWKFARTNAVASLGKLPAKPRANVSHATLPIASHQAAHPLVQASRVYYVSRDLICSFNFSPELVTFKPVYRKGHRYGTLVARIDRRSVFIDLGFRRG